MSFLKSLSVEVRDSLLESIPYVDEPNGSGYADGMDKINIGDNNGVMNYSQIFSFLGNRIKIPAGGRLRETNRLPSPQSLRTGDCVQFGGHRGCGSFYVIWLKKGIYAHDVEFLEKFKASCGVWEGDVSDDHSTVTKKRKLTSVSTDEYLPFNEEAVVVTFLPRDADGPHNDGRHDCYLTIHPDENGYAPSTALASVPREYFKHLEGNVFMFDPLITHSKSFFGRETIAAKETTKWQEMPDFPYGYYGYVNENASEDIDWYSFITPDEDRDEGEDECSQPKLLQIRQLLNDHFKPDDWVSDDDNDGIR